MNEAKLSTGTIEQTAIDKLQVEFSGKVIRQGDEGFDEARRVYNGMFSERNPAAILQCTSPEDVVAAVNFVRENGFLFAVKSGGHSIAGFSAIDGGVLIDLSQMTDVEVDPDAKVARAQAGVKWAAFDAATQEHGLATPGGFVSTTGVAGLTLNGGIGLLSPKHGLTCDNLVGAEVVTASGEVLWVSEDENPDLLWGLRGGGGNFGIVTRFDLRLFPVTDVYLRGAMYPAERGAAVLRSYREGVAGSPDDLLTAAIFSTVAEHPMMPEEMDGQKVWTVLAAYIGPESEGEPLTDFIPALPDPLASFGMQIPYVMAQQFQDETALWGRQNYWKSGLLDELSDEVIDKVAELAPTVPSPFCTVTLLSLGGAIAAVDEDATAYSHRDAKFDFSIDNIWGDPAENEAQIAWSRDFFAQVHPFTRGVYLNFIGDEGLDRVREAYGKKYARLSELKRKYDPSNLFRLNQNIKP